MLRSLVFPVLLASLVILFVPSRVSSVSPPTTLTHPTFTLVVDGERTPLQGQSLVAWVKELQPRATLLGRVHFIICPDGTVESVYPTPDQDEELYYTPIPTERDTISSILSPTIS